MLADNQPGDYSELIARHAAAKTYRDGKAAEARRLAAAYQREADYWQARPTHDLLLEMESDSQREASDKEDREWRKIEEQDARQASLSDSYQTGILHGAAGGVFLWWLFWRLVALIRWLT